MSTYVLHILIIIAIQLPSVLGYNLIFGKGKILYFGHVGLVLCNAYVVFLTLRLTESILLSLSVGFFSCIALSLLMSWLALRLAGDAFGIVSIAFHFAILSVILTSKFTRGALGIAGIVRPSLLQSPQSFALFAAILALLAIVCAKCVDRSKLGRSLSALAENTHHAEAVGVSRSRSTILAFLFGGLFSFITSLLLPFYLQLLHPNDYRFDSLVFLVTLVVAGKPGSVRGVTLASIALIFLKEGLRFMSLPPNLIGPIRLLLFGLILLFSVYIRRQTLFPQARTV